MSRVTREHLIALGCKEKQNAMGTTYFENEAGDKVAKSCGKCREVITLDGFSGQKGRSDGLRSACRRCRSEYSRKYHEDNPQKRQKRIRIEPSPQEVMENKRIRLEVSKEKKRVMSRKYREDNPEKVREIKRKYHEENKEKVSESFRLYRQANPEKHRDSVRKWQSDNLAKCKLYAQLRRARKALLPDTFTLEQKANVLLRFNNSCSMTGSTKYHMDHAIPIKCGHGGTTRENMIPLRGDLNISKNDRHIFEWFNSNRERFGLSQAKFDALISYLAEVNGMTTKEYRMYVDWCFDNPRDIETEESA